MSAKPTLNVVLLWHMHQPEYRDQRNGQFALPWTYLHAIKDYVDMAAHLEANPAARAVVNFVPILLEQLEDYAQQIDAFRQQGTAIRDPLLEALIQPVQHESESKRLELVRQCLRANETQLINRFPGFRRLAEMARWLLEHPQSVCYLTDQFLADLLVWFHIAWLGETVRREHPLIREMIRQEANFTLHQRRELVSLIGELIAGVIPRYRKLAEDGQVELSLTPYAHPIMPLLLSLDALQEAMPDAPLPLTPAYPGGEARVRWHLEQGLAVFERLFGMRPAGCWPSEGSLSEATLTLLGEYGFAWSASGESVLHNSLHAGGGVKEGACIHRPYHHGADAPLCFFRDDGLSDLIGFTYHDWHADDAVANLMHHLEQIAEACSANPDAIVSIIMDGENAWEYYPQNGYYFLDALYRQLATHPQLNLTTYREYLAGQPKPSPLPRLVAGSWVYGTFSTWAGSAEKNHGWDLLAEAKRAVDRKLASGTVDTAQRERIEQQLAICEGSDWFWWIGDYNPAESVHDFDYLYRHHLSNLYLILGETPPPHLAEVISHGSGAPAMGGVMRRGHE